MKKGLILEGGAMRGLFTAGICDVMMKNGIEFDGMIGVSAGAAFGCNYKSGQIGRVLRYNLKYARDRRYCSLHSLVTTGDLYSAAFCYHEIPEKLDIFDVEAFISNPMEYYVVCTDIVTGEPVYRKCDTVDYNNLEWIRASASMPLVSRIVEVDGYELLDGGIADSVPLKYFESIGYDRNVVVLTQPATYIKGENKAMPLVRRRLKKYPGVIKAMENRHIMYNNTIKEICEKEKKGEILVLRPEAPLPVGRVERNPERLQATYDVGRKVGEHNLERIKEYLR
ncbi:MAG: patatin family protein [Eubacteriales bacterium]|nr:patatin family protein [Eubacteriales bacterium]